LDKHLSIQVRVVDASGKVLGSGRNLAALFQQFTPPAPDRQPTHALARVGLKTWDFETLPASVTTQEGAIEIKGYPALVDQIDHVDIVVFEDVGSAERAHAQGVARLLALSLPDQRRYLQKQLPGLKALGLQYAARGDAPRLQADLIDAIFRHTLVDDQPIVRTAALFQERLEGRGQLFERGQRLVAALTEALKTATRIEILLAKLVSPPVQATRMDIDAQLQWLFRARFVTQIEAPWLMSYARYLKAIDYRLDKLPGNLARENENLAKVARFQTRLTGLSVEQRRLAGEFEWLLQEYRVSLFAQPVGTRVPISEKRLEKAWTELESALR